MNLREQIAELQHEQWSGWMEYLFSKCSFLPEGDVAIPAWAVKRWQRQMKTPYKELLNEERDSDRVEADKILSLPVEGVEVEEKCSNCEGTGDMLDDTWGRWDKVCCNRCQGTGTIRRPVTLQELVDMAKEGRVIISEKT